MVTQVVRVLHKLELPKSYKTHQVRVKFVNHINHLEVSLVLACTKRLEVY